MTYTDSNTNSYILTSDLESLHLDTNNSELNSLNSTSIQELNSSIKSVSFSPLASCIPLTLLNDDHDDDDDKDREGIRKGRPKVSIRTYSLETPSIKQSWSKVVSSISSSLQPLLSPSTTTGNIGGVCSISPRSYFDDPCPLSMIKNYKKDQDESDLEEEELSNSRNHLSIRLPSLSRRLSSTSSTTTFSSPVLVGRSTRSQSLDSKPLPRSCLKSPERTTSTPLPSLPLISSTSTVTAHSPPLPLLSCSPFSISEISLSPTSSTISTSTVSANVDFIPISKCCLSCTRATLYGKSEEWKELFSRGAKRKRRLCEFVDVRGNVGVDEVEGNVDIKEENAMVKEEGEGEGEEEEEEGEDAEGIEKKWKNIVVDELPNLKSISSSTSSPDNSSNTTPLLSTSTPSPSSSPIPKPNPISTTSIESDSELKDIYIPPPTPLSTVSTIKSVAKPRRRFSLSGLIDSSINSGSGGRNYT